MISSSLPKKIWHKQRTWLLMVVVAGLIFFAEFLGLATPIKSGLMSWLSPLLSFNVSLGQKVTAPVQQLNKAYKSAYRVQDLERRLAQAEAEVGRLKQLEKENQDLKKMLQNSDRSLEPALISSPILTWAQPAVAAGSQQGVKPSAPVLVNNTLVGRISQVRPDFSYIQLLKDRSTKPVLAETESGIQGLIQGDGRRVILTELPTESELSVGEKVVTLGQEGIGSGLFIGQIASIQSGHSAAVKQAVVEQYVSFYEAVAVEIRI
ncbi:MAG: hypothetical protein GF381_02650 [Candidatus Pacebacteria bacterium]|nr:hypothetical protein [Candidatus Paceibacterota bacterium]